MMHTMSQEQRDFAEQNHGLVWKYLRSKNFPPDEFYDIVIFGYMHAVQVYLEKEELRKNYPFFQIAYRNMDYKIGAYYRNANREKRKETAISLSTPVSGTDSLTLLDTLPSKEEPTEDLVVASVIYEEILKKATPKQRGIAEAYMAGYSGRKAEKLAGTASSACSVCLYNLRKKLLKSNMFDRKNNHFIINA